MAELLWSTFLLGLLVITLATAECPDGCDQPVAIYKDLQCKPVYAKPTDCCPIKYDCSSITNRPENKCTYKGKSYDVGSQIPKEETYPNCQIGCSCRGSEDILCAILDCPEWLGMRPKAGNHLTYTLNECCSTGQKSAPYEICKVGDREYKEGEQFSGNKRCTNCVCGKGWKGKYEAPFCAETTCTDEMRSLDKIKANCAPSYLGSNACCPFSWICPNDDKANDNIVTASATKDNKEKCKYGSKMLNVGDKFKRIEKISDYDRFEINCECVIPPFLTCAQKQVFDKAKTPQHIKDALGLKD